MTKKYLLIIKNEYYTTHAFYTLEEAKVREKIENNNYGLSTAIIDLKDIEWKR
ncbi:MULTISPECIES: hypothetical protein [Spiroplasma]|uniref:Uncharacterized protein n=1 Tax=Spiroplasma citri TaxID=2133 RepID=Q14MD0_SPICI|nr:MULTISPECIES: hypothetical protein [Spiroplasma]APE74653.1 hypothetical protein SCITRI_00760 [Spiroplasma citri]QIA66886.1 hypothetical protein GMI18_04020 [Spiroplasma citri]QIA68711.1 hypothetical protein GL298_03820 [Spiroplasma citri]QIA70572.1 hypothetical protein GL981_03830 [Spiroplasma citri]QIA72112.1 hypothetical protein GL981_12600 [Spiroplasma citri]